MTKRPLRTAAVAHPRTTGARIRYARLDSNLSQEALAAGISSITKVKIGKSLVSQWECDSIASPSPANLFAIQAVTGFSVEWLATGSGEQRANVRSAELDIDRLKLVLKAIAPDRTGIPREARAIALLYKVLTSSPSMSSPLLAEMAQGIK
ncbi:helix-turn-helix domain-containing protein [Lysobacter sp. CA199]|uniref:helix-turn-helix domain-containing protein n=1 Tax=Lysobacter sp. CA199 TaxID=3455608 RepID=UPI003F8D2E78